MLMTRGAFFLMLLVLALVGVGVWCRRKGYPTLATIAWTMAATLTALLVLGATGVLGA